MEDVGGSMGSVLFFSSFMTLARDLADSASEGMLSVGTVDCVDVRAMLSWVAKL